MSAARPLEELQRLADRIGAVIALTTDRDAREPRGGRRAYTREPGATLRKLVVVRPMQLDRYTRWERLARGLVLAEVMLDGLNVDQAASRILDQLGPAVERRNAA